MKIKYKLLMFILTFAVVFGLWFLYQNFSGITGAAVAESKIIPAEEGAAIEVYFCPRDDCAEKLVGLIAGAQSMDCALYDLTLSNVKDALKEKYYRLVVDKDYEKYVKGMNYKTNRGASGLMHNKFCVFDNKTIISGSFNPTTKQNTIDNNNIIIISSKYLAENYNAEFIELWSSRFAEGEPVKHQRINYNGELIENYFCPDDDCTSHLIETLQNAESEIKFLVYAFTEDKIGDVLLNKIKENVSVRGVFDKSQSYSQYSEFARLNGSADVRVENSKGLLHHKVFIIDRKIVITGSFNPTLSANTKNDENLLIIHSPTIAEKYLEEFDYVWNQTIT
ncbi:MAG: DUF1669 domain-containing protein [DPANN group archaeon]|nr:DUF1669 domain-containing protein [DPANN group archaeon]